MNHMPRTALLLHRVASVAASLLALTGCAQFTTGDAERAGLQAAADAAGRAYLDCLDAQASRYVGTTGDARSVVNVARSNCTAARDAAGRAQSGLLSTQYIMSGPEVDAALADLDARGEAAIAEKILAAGPAPVATASAAPAPSAPATGATLPPAGDPSAAGAGAYLDCMRDQATRWADVAEPATVIADAAHGRCSGRLAGVPARSGAEAEGRAIATGIVLDRKAGAAATAP
jgi:hypothetical protein